MPTCSNCKPRDTGRWTRPATNTPANCGIIENMKNRTSLPNAATPATTTHHQPSYLALYQSGELSRRVEQAQSALAACRLCPRHCGINRNEETQGFCNTGRYALVSSAFPHMGEEDCLRGWNGSGTIFFSMCNLGCVFCQNFDISHAGIGQEVRPAQLANMMLQLQAMGCHNINLVTPEHVVAQILESLLIAVEQGLRLPLVYNTSAYDAPETLSLLDGVIDIYMPDFKMWSAERSHRYMHASNYPDIARTTLKEMHRQVGDLQLDEDGLAVRGLLVRHLVMPGMLEESMAILRFLAEELSPHTYVNIMAQYHPAGKVNSERFPEINHRLPTSEYADALRFAYEMGLERLDNRRKHWWIG